MKSLHTSFFVVVGLTLLPNATTQLVDGKGLFSYNPLADNGPAFWDTLDTDDENQCGGDRQSPIPLYAANECTTTNARYTLFGGTCGTDSFNYFNNDHSVEYEYPEDGSCEPNTLQMPGVDGVYELAQCHTHTGSEHTVEGFYANFELHCVHNLKSGSGEGFVDGGYTTNTQAVLGMFILVDSQETNEAFQPLLDGWQAYQDARLKGCARRLGAAAASASSSKAEEKPHRKLTSFNVYDLTSPDAYYWYSGSLTTPACTENLWWNVANEAIHLSLDQGVQLRDLILGYVDDNCEPATGANPFNGFTSRPPQPLNGRTVSKQCLDGGSPSCGERGDDCEYESDCCHGFRCKRGTCKKRRGSSGSRGSGGMMMMGMRRKKPIKKKSWN